MENGVFQIQICLVTPMQSPVIKNELGPPLTKGRREVVGNVVVVFPTPQTALRRANHVIIVEKPIMYNNIVSSSRKITKAKETLVTRRPRPFRWWVLTVQFSQYATVKVLPNRLGYQWPNLVKGSYST